MVIVWKQTQHHGAKSFLKNSLLLIRSSSVFYCTSKIPYRVRMIPPLDPILSHTTPLVECILSHVIPPLDSILSHTTPLVDCILSHVMPPLDPIRRHTSPPQDPVLRHMISLHTLAPYLLEFPSNLHQMVPSLHVSRLNFVRLFHLSHPCYTTHLSRPGCSESNA
jgi:hypothetical protein